MRRTFLALTVMTILLAPGVAPAWALLSDDELDIIAAGTGSCALVGLSAPCTFSLIQVFQPGAAPVTALTAVTPPPSGEVTIKQKVRVPPSGGAFSTSVRQEHHRR